MFKKPGVTHIQKPIVTKISIKPTEGILGKITNPTCYQEVIRDKSFSVQNADKYLNALEQNYKYYGVPFKKLEVLESIKKYRDVIEPENHFTYPDVIPVKLNVLKSGKVRIKIIHHMAQMWEKYRQGARPPHKLLVSVYKSMGYSQEFIDKMNKSHERKKILAIKYEKIVNNIFEKPTKKKVIPQKKKKPIEEHEIVEEDEEENDDNEPEEDEAIVVDEDDDEEECVDEDIEPPDAD
jgi:hypothetical protein